MQESVRWMKDVELEMKADNLNTVQVSEIKIRM